MHTSKLTEAELDAAIAERARPWPHCTGACDQGRTPCTCETGVPAMWDVEAEHPLLTAALCALAIVGTIAACALVPWGFQP